MSLIDELKQYMDGMEERITKKIAESAFRTADGQHTATDTRAIAGLMDWTVKADEDYRRVLAELAELKLRIDRLEGK